jgi:hypothetical protein
MPAAWRWVGWMVVIGFMIAVFFTVLVFGGL